MNPTLETQSASKPGNSPFAALVAMFYEPSRAFAMLETRSHAWLALALILLTTGGLLMWYFSVVNFDWLIEEMLSTTKNADERQQAKKMMSKQFMQYSALGGTLVMLPLMFALTGLYLMLAGKVLNQALGYGKAFALAVWAAVPTLLLLPLGAVQILMTPGGDYGFSELNALSLNQLLFQFPMQHPMAGLTDSISVPSIWNAVLLVIGFQVWAKTPLATAIKVVVIPYLTIYGIWAAMP
jgi:hypothetical protein